jgi:hypothetical protein
MKLTLTIAAKLRVIPICFAQPDYLGRTSSESSIAGYARSTTAARLGVIDPCNLDQNVSGGMRFLAWLMRRFRNDLTLVAAAYYVEDVIARRGLAYRNAAVVVYVSKVRSAYLCEERVESLCK